MGLDKIQDVLDEFRLQRQIEDLPQNEPKNPERRSSRITDSATTAPDRGIETRSRSVSIGQGNFKEEAKQYLLDQYTVDNRLFCQICEAPMPFKLADGSPYFEATEFFKTNDLKKRHRQNYLALCPNHNAMVTHANDSKDMIKDLFLQLEEDEVRMKVILAQEEKTIYFTKTHVFDLKTIIQAEQANIQDD